MFKNLKFLLKLCDARCFADEDNDGYGGYGGSTSGSDSQANADSMGGYSGGADSIGGYGDSSGGGINDSNGGISFGSFKETEKNLGLDGYNDYSVTFGEDDTATIIDNITGQSVTVKDGIAIDGSLDGFGVEPGDVKSAGLNAQGQFEETMVTEPGKTMVNTYTDETKTTLIGATGEITLFGIPAKINVDYTGKTTITSGGTQASIDANGNITGDKNMFSGDDVGGVKGFIDGIKGLAKTVFNSVPTAAKALLGLVTAGIPGGIAGLTAKDKTLSLSEQRNLAQLQGLANMSTDPNSTNDDILNALNGMDDGNGKSIVTGEPITQDNVFNPGGDTQIPTEDLPAMNTGFNYDKQGIINAYDRGDRSRGEIIQEIYREGLGRNPDLEGYKYWLEKSNVPTDKLYEAIRNSAVNEYNVDFKDFNINRTADFSEANMLREDTINVAKAQMNIAQGQLANFEEFYGNPLENYNQWFERLDPYQAQALGQSEIKQNYADISNQAIADFARRGITDSGILSSVMVNFDIAEAEALAANRAQNMANYTAIAQNDANIRMADVQNKFNMRNTLTQNQFNQANTLMNAQSNQANAFDAQTQFNTQMDINRAMSLADMDYKYAALGVQDAANKAQIAYNERALDAGIANNAANREAQEEADKWALGTTLFTSLLS